VLPGQDLAVALLAGRPRSDRTVATGVCRTQVPFLVGMLDKVRADFAAQVGRLTEGQRRGVW
jgi:hypothetical protein